MLNKESTDGCLRPLFGFSSRVSLLLLVRSFSKYMRGPSLRVGIGFALSFPDGIVRLFANADFQIMSKVENDRTGPKVFLCVCPGGTRAAAKRRHEDNIICLLSQTTGADIN